jgi:hypothetical protein
MKLAAKDFKRLQWAIAFLVITILVGGGSAWTIQQLKKSSEKGLQEAAAASKDWQRKLARAREEQQELLDKIGRFQALQAGGYIGPEQRLDWIETIARIKAARRISKLEYEFAPQRPVDVSLLPEGGSAGGFEIMSSQMRLETHVLHEAELLGFLVELRDAVKAVVKVSSCTVERLEPGNTERSNNAQLRARCMLEWITLREGK